jgi:hypothetical protein
MKWLFVTAGGLDGEGGEHRLRKRRGFGLECILALVGNVSLELLLVYLLEYD